MTYFKKLPFQFDAAHLQSDLAKVGEDEWVKHFNQGYYEGNWSVAPLRSIGGQTKKIYSDPFSKEPFGDTEILARCEYVREILDVLQCEKETVRFMTLGAGSKIREHRDYFMGVEHGCLRLHIPVVTNEKVEFYLADELVKMQTGELWYLDFYQKHRVENHGDEDRVHLVIDCKPSDWLIDLIK